MLIVGLALWGGQSLAESSQSRYSADGLYNLANSYARAGKPGLAVLNYERAALLAPNDADINANLEYVRTGACLRSRAIVLHASSKPLAQPCRHGPGFSELLLPAADCWPEELWRAFDGFGSAGSCSASY